MSTQTDQTVEQTDLPDLHVLATLAAQPRFNKLDSNKAAVRAALDLWREADGLLKHERALADAMYRHYRKPLENLSQPKQWPASFGDFLKLVVQGKDEAEQLCRFRKFLRSLRDAKVVPLRELRERLKSSECIQDRDSHMTEVEARQYSDARSQHIDKLIKKEGVTGDYVEEALLTYRKLKFTKQRWNQLAIEFRHFWEHDTSEQRRAIGRKGGQSNAARLARKKSS